MTSWITGLLQWLMKSSPSPWMNLMLLTKFHLILVTGTIIQMVMARTTTTASHGTRKVTTSHGRTETTNGKTRIISHGKIRIKSDGKTIKAKVINLVILVLHCLKIKNSLFQQIVMKMCSRPSAPWLKLKSTRLNNQAAMEKKLMK